MFCYEPSENTVSIDSQYLYNYDGNFITSKTISTNIPMIKTAGRAEQAFGGAVRQVEADGTSFTLYNKDNSCYLFDNSLVFCDGISTDVFNWTKDVQNLSSFMEFNSATVANGKVICDPPLIDSQENNIIIEIVFIICCTIAILGTVIIIVILFLVLIPDFSQIYIEYVREGLIGHAI